MDLITVVPSIRQTGNLLSDVLFTYLVDPENLHFPYFLEFLDLLLLQGCRESQVVQVSQLNP